MLWIFVITGAFGGCVRALLGFLKALSRGERMRIGYFLLTLVEGGVIGGVLGSMFEVDYRVAALAAYVGTDILENLVHRAVPQKPVLRKS